MTTTNKVLIGAVLFAGFISWVMYQNLVVQPRMELGYKALLEEKREQNYKNCLLQADIDYDYNWNAQCKAQGKTKSCSLPLFIANDVDNIYAENKKNCVTMYK